MLAAVARRSVPVLVVVLALFAALLALFVPLVLVPLALTGVFPHLLLSFAIDASLALGAWVLLRRERSTSTGS